MREILMKSSSVHDKKITRLNLYCEWKIYTKKCVNEYSQMKIHLAAENTLSL